MGAGAATFQIAPTSALLSAPVPVALSPHLRDAAEPVEDGVLEDETPDRRRAVRTRRHQDAGVGVVRPSDRFARGDRDELGSRTVLAGKRGHEDAHLGGQRRQEAAVVERTLVRHPLERHGRVLEPRPVVRPAVGDVAHELELCDALEVVPEPEVADHGGRDDRGPRPVTAEADVAELDLDVAGFATDASVETNGRYAYASDGLLASTRSTHSAGWQTPTAGICW
jgi:hypothetical protein